MKLLQNNVIRVIKAILIVFILGFFFVQLKQPSDSYTDFQTVVDVSLKDKDMSEFVQADNLQIKRFLSLNPDDYTNIIYYKNVDTMKAGEIVIVRFKDNSQSIAFKDAMRNRIANQRNVFDGYIEEESEYLRKAIIDVQANYALFVVGSDASSVAKLFESAL